MENTSESHNITQQPKNPKQHWWIRTIGYIKHKFGEHYAKKEKESPQDYAARINAMATVWIAFFTLVITVVGVLQYWGSESVAKATRDANRAYLWVEDVKVIMKTTDKGFQPTINYEISNTGITPGIITRIPLIVGIATGEVIPHFPEFPLSEPHIYSFWAPNSKKWWLDVTPPPCEMGELNKLILGKSSIYIRGVIEFIDVFKKRHKSNFLYRVNLMNGETTSAKPVGPIKFWEFD